MLSNFEYNRKNAVSYAEKWALGRNPRYFDFEKIGGDCTNFASQCIYAGSGVMNYTPTFGWYYNSANSRSPSWSGVPFLYNFLISNKSVGPYADVVSIDKIISGDLIQLGDEYGGFFHSLIVCEVGEPPDFHNILISTHTDDVYLQPLDTYTFKNIRYLHIIGVRKWQP